MKQVESNIGINWRSASNSQTSYTSLCATCVGGLAVQASSSSSLSSPFLLRFFFIRPIVSREPHTIQQQTKRPVPSVRRRKTHTIAQRKNTESTKGMCRDVGTEGMHAGRHTAKGRNKKRQGQGKGRPANKTRSCDCSHLKSTLQARPGSRPL